MGKTYILGNETTSLWARAYGDVTIIRGLNVYDSKEINDFVINFLRGATVDDKVIIDLDCTNLGMLALEMAMHIRLSVVDLKEKSLLPIVLVSFFPLQRFLRHNVGSQFFLSQKGYVFCNPNELEENLPNVSGISPEEYREVFLDRIRVNPDETIGNHSMANMWGADVLYRITGIGKGAQSDETGREKAKLYYKYVLLKTTNIMDIMNDNVHGGQVLNARKPNCKGKKILLIDDEAEKGWADVLDKWLDGADLDVCPDPVGSYGELPEEKRSLIEKDHYDLYLLDLRLLGTKEEDIYDTEEFSGMRILHELKRINIGNQVIILTASNKAWNMKALLDAGADGYYIKESPESLLPDSFSENNFRSLQDEIVTALERNNYKRKLYRDIQELRRVVENSKSLNKDFADDLLEHIDASKNSVMKAKSDDDFAYSYLALFQVMECICKEYVRVEENVWRVGNRPLCYYNLRGYKAVLGSKMDKPLPSIKEKLTAVYIEVCKYEDTKFIRETLGTIIDLRNSFVHDRNELRSRADLQKIFTEEGFIELLQAVGKIIRPLC